MTKRLRPPKPPKLEKGRGDIYVSVGDDSPDPPEGDELATWTGDLCLGLAPNEAIALATDLLLAHRNAKSEMVQVWIPPSTVRVYKPEK